VRLLLSTAPWESSQLPPVPPSFAYILLFPSQFPFLPTLFPPFLIPIYPIHPGAPGDTLQRLFPDLPKLFSALLSPFDLLAIFMNFGWEASNAPS
jgi:hypothetical protein